jgi:hypothetical protein
MLPLQAESTLRKNMVSEESENDINISFELLIFLYNYEI